MAAIEQLPSGLWRARVRRQGHPTQSKSFRLKLDAERWSAKIEGEQDRGTWRDTSTADKITLAALLADYAGAVQHKASTMPYLLKRLSADLGRHSLAALTPAVLVAWRDRRLECVASGTVQRELSALGGALTWAIKDRLIAMPAGNPVSAIRRPQTGRARDRRLEPGEEQRLLEALGDRAGEVKGAKRAGAYRVGTRNPWLRPLVQFALETATRQGELLALAWDNVDLKAQTAHLEDTKNGESRTVPLSSRAVAVLEALPRSSGMDGRVFPISAQAVKLAWKRACRRAGIEGLHFHDLRHEATSRLAEKLPNLIELAAVTGHKDLRMLKRYYHPRATDLARKLG